MHKKNTKDRFLIEKEHKTAFKKIKLLTRYSPKTFCEE
jgi:hypothetical protein